MPVPPSANIHRLTASDIPLFRSLMELFGRAFEDETAYGLSPSGDGYVRDLLDSDSFIALAALDTPNAREESGMSNGSLIGGLAAYVLRKFEQERSEIYIYDLAVDTRYRRRGIATALINHLKPIAKACNAWVIFVQADQGDDPAIALYTKLGHREDVLHFDIPVD